MRECAGCSDKDDNARFEQLDDNELDELLQRFYVAMTPEKLIRIGNRRNRSM
jgi:cytochrome b involved in lipid metabolism